jgi:hypothetical protein
MLQPRTPGHRRLRFWLPLAALAVVLALAGCASAGPVGEVEVANVNGHGISFSDYQQALRFFAAGQQQTTPIAWQTVAGRQGLASVQSGALGFLINIELVDQQAQACHVNVTAADIAKQRAQLQAVIKNGANNPSIAPLIPVFTPRLLELFARFDADQAALINTISVPSVDLRQIVVGSQDEANQLQQQAQQGSDFGELAKQHSLDATTASSGGVVGTFVLGQIGQQSPSFERQVFTNYTPVATGGCYRQYRYAGSAVRYLIVPASNNQYVLYRVQMSDQALKDVKDAQTQSAALGAWLTQVVRARANVTTYIAAPTTEQLPSGQ